MGVGMLWAAALTAVVSFAGLGSCANILTVSTVPSTSHSLWYNRLVGILADRGHKLIFLDIEPERKRHPNVTHFHMEGATHWREDLNENNKPGVLEAMSSTTPKETMDNFVGLETHLCSILINSSGLAQFLAKHSNTKFDLILMDYMCDSLFGLVHHFGDPPFIVATAYSEPAKLLRGVGLYDNPSYVPAHLSNLPNRMDTFQRGLNLFYTLYGWWIQEWLINPVADHNAKRVFGAETPRVADILKSVHLVMVNTHFAFTGSKPLMPAVVPIAGFHIDPPKPLPQAMKDFLDGAKEGAVYMSLGSNLASTHLSSIKRRMYLEAFRSLPYRVLWKYEDESLEGLPPNVMTAKWLPQGDVLGHPNVKCFISHGGLLGSQEAIYHGVPVIGIPFMLDQQEVLINLERKGVAIRLDYRSLTQEAIQKSVNRIFDDQSFSRNMQQLSSAFRDAPDTPKERAIFWIEYAIRRRGQPNFLRSAALDLTWYQILMLDLLLYAVLALLIASLLLKRLIGSIYSLFFNKTKSDKVKKS